MKEKKEGSKNSFNFKKSVQKPVDEDTYTLSSQEYKRVQDMAFKQAQQKNC